MAFLFMKEVTMLMEYTDFAYIFSKEAAEMFFNNVANASAASYMQLPATLFNFATIIQCVITSATKFQNIAYIITSLPRRFNIITNYYSSKSSENTRPKPMSSCD